MSKLNRRDPRLLTNTLPWLGPYDLDIFVDSGAFSIYQNLAKGKRNVGADKLSVDSYGKYLLENEEHYSAAANFDVMPTKDSPQSKEEAAEGSWKNYRHLLKMGVKKLVPVFHMGERSHWMHKILDGGCDFVAVSVSGRSRRLMHAKQIFAGRRYDLDRLFEHLVDSAGRPVVKVHGLAVTDPSLVADYPWYSCDSSTWALGAGYGMVFVPTLTEDGKWDFVKFSRVGFTDGLLGSELRKNAPHYSRFSEKGRDIIERYFTEIDVDIHNLHRCPRTRRMANLIFFELLAKSIKPKSVKRAGAGFVPVAAPAKLRGSLPASTIIYPALGNLRPCLNLFMLAGVHKALVSYYVVRSLKLSDLKNRPARKFLAEE